VIATGERLETKTGYDFYVGHVFRATSCQCSSRPTGSMRSTPFVPTGSTRSAGGDTVTELDPRSEVERLAGMTDAEVAAQVDAEIEEAKRQGATWQPAPGGDRLGPEGRTVPVSMRMPSGLQNAIKEIASARGVRYQTLIMRWLEEKVADERSVADTVLIRITADALRRALETGQLALDAPRKAS
jgi:hypothetical protein